MTPEQIQKMAEGCPPSAIGKDHEEVITWLAEKHIALQEQVQKLAAENCIQDFIISAVRDLARETDGVSGWHLNGDLATWDEVLPELSHSDTPATDAVIREIGAKAVEGFVSKLAGRLKTAGGGDGYHSNPYPECAEYIELKGGDYVEALRAGEQP